MLSNIAKLSSALIAMATPFIMPVSGMSPRPAPSPLPSVSPTAAVVSSIQLGAAQFGLTVTVPWVVFSGNYAFAEIDLPNDTSKTGVLENVGPGWEQIGGVAGQMTVGEMEDLGVDATDAQALSTEGSTAPS